MRHEHTPPRPSEYAKHWALDPSVAFLNHGSYGAAPKAVLESQRRWQDTMEAEPVRFFTAELPEALVTTRARLAAFLGCDTDGLVMVPNATLGVATALLSAPLGPGDEIIVNHHEYASCLNEIERDARRRGYGVRTAAIPFPIAHADQAFDAIMGAVTPSTRLVLLSWVSSATALVMPVEQIVRELRGRGIMSLIDAAHAPGQVKMDLSALGADFVTGNLHKWVCAPKGSGFLWIAPRHREATQPLALSSRAGWMPEGGNRLHHLFDYVGTADYTAWLAIPDALDTMSSMLPGGWDAVRAHNNTLLREAHTLICDALGAEPSAPDAMLAHMASIPLPPLQSESGPPPDWGDPLWIVLKDKYGIQVPVWTSGGLGVRILRLSAQIYNSTEQYEHLAEALRTELQR